MTGKDLKTALKALGWSQAELARRIDVNENTIRRWKLSANIPGPVSAYVVLSLQVSLLVALTNPASRR